MLLQNFDAQVLSVMLNGNEWVFKTAYTMSDTLSWCELTDYILEVKLLCNEISNLVQRKYVSLFWLK